MFKNSSFLSEIKILSAAALPFAGMAVARIFAPILKTVVNSSPGMNSKLAVPVSAQGTSYFVSHSNPYFR